MEFSKDIEEFIAACLKKPHPESYLIGVLHEVQEEYGYLTNEMMDRVSKLMQIPTAKIFGVVSFYHYFCLKPRGRYVITICTGTACHVKGSNVVLKKLEEELGIELGETTKDGLFTLEEARCLGMCALAPVLKINEEVHPQVTPDQIHGILQKYFALEKKA